MIKKFIIYLILFVSISLSGQITLGDELITKDGSRLNGKVVNEEDGILKFETTYAGTVHIKWDQISELRTQIPVKILLKNEKTVMTQFVKNQDEIMIVEVEPSKPPIIYNHKELAFINPAAWQLGESMQISGAVNLALKSQRGNTDKDELDIDGNLLFRRKNDRLTLRGHIEKDKNRGETTADAWDASAKYDYFLSKKWFIGGSTRVEQDQFQDLKLRVSAGPFVGYQFFETKKMNLNSSIGPSRTLEDFREADDNDYWSLSWSNDFDVYVFGEYIQFYHRHSGLWNFEDIDDVVFDGWTGFRVPLLLGLVASTEIRTEYDNAPADDVDRLDTTYRVKLGYQW